MGSGLGIALRWDAVITEELFPGVTSKKRPKRNAIPPLPPREGEGKGNGREREGEGEGEGAGHIAPFRYIPLTIGVPPLKIYSRRGRRPRLK